MQRVFIRYAVTACLLGSILCVACNSNKSPETSPADSSAIPADTVQVLPVDTNTPQMPVINTDTSAIAAMPVLKPADSIQPK